MLTVSRRSVGGLAGLAGLVVASTACDPIHFGSSTTSARSPDELLVEQVVVDVRRARDVAAVDGRTELVTLHEAHLRALGAPTETSPSASPTVAPLAVGTSETTLKAQLTAAALQAEDGSLARMLASMSAAIAQQLTVLR